MYILVSTVSTGRYYCLYWVLRTGMYVSIYEHLYLYLYLYLYRYVPIRVQVSLYLCISVFVLRTVCTCIYVLVFCMSTYTVWWITIRRWQYTYSNNSHDNDDVGVAKGFIDRLTRFDQSYIHNKKTQWRACVCACRTALGALFCWFARDTSIDTYWHIDCRILTRGLSDVVAGSPRRSMVVRRDMAWETLGLAAGKHRGHCLISWWVRLQMVIHWCFWKSQKKEDRCPVKL